MTWSSSYQAVLSVLVRNFTFEFPDGPSTVIGSHSSLMTRPNVEGEGGFKVPIIVRKFVAKNREPS